MKNKNIEDFFKVIKKKIKSHLVLHKPLIDKSDKDSINLSLKKGEVSTYGKNTELFEKKLSIFMGTNNVVSTINGTCALHAILSYLKFNNSDEILVQSLTFVATVNPILYVGASPHFIDSCFRSLAADPNKLDTYLNSKIFKKKNNYLFNVKTKKRVRALLITHIYGYPAEIIKLKKIAKKYNLILIEDAAETVGTVLNNKKIGTHGDFSFLSFNGNKTITTGAGGAIICKKKNDYKKIKHSITTSKIKNTLIPDHDSMGFNYRMPSLNASLGLAQLKKINKILKAKLSVFNMYTSSYSKLEKDFKIYFSSNPEKFNNNWIVLIICKNKKIRDIFLKFSKKYKVPIKPIWKPMHKLKYLKHFPKMNLKIANLLSDTVICLPSSPHIKLK
jgi:perosamine synthetase